MSRRALPFVLAVCVAFTGAHRLTAQTDVIRGRVTSAAPGERPIENVTVTATSLSGNVNRATKTDRSGRYTITFPGGDGDYFVTFVVIGYVPRRFEVKRLADEDILIADARLMPAATLDTVVTVAQRPRNRPGRGDGPPDVSGTDRPVGATVLPADQQGDLSAMAAVLPGVLAILGTNGDPSGFSVFGLDADQNNTTLNGMTSGVTEIPRDANVSVSLATSPYDVSRGQFSGGQLTIRTLPGSNYLTRTSSMLFAAPQLEWTDPAGRALGQRYTNANIGGVLSGPIAFDKAFYNISYQAGRRANDLQTLLNTDPLGLKTAGVAPDSVSRLLDVLRDERVVATVPGFPNDRRTDQGLLLSSVDFTPPRSGSGQAYNLTVNGSWIRSSPTGSLLTAMPASTVTTTNWNGSVVARHSGYFGFGVLSETGVAVGASHRYLSPYLVLPGGSVLVNSDFADGTSGVQSIAFGGSTFRSSTTTTSVDVTNQLSWFSPNNRHRVRLTSEIRRDAYALDQGSNQLGTFAFNSLADLQAGVPSSFTRQLTGIHNTSRELIAGVSLGDSYRVSPNLQIVYGARVDANRFLDRPATNRDIERLFGANNDRVPNGVYVSPRVGFAWTYGTASQIGAFEGAARAPRAVIRGGIGLFQNAVSATLPSQAIANTGLPGGVQQFTCVGAAAPTPNWGEYAADPSAIPTACADGTTGTVFATRAPNVTLFARDYVPQRSLRSNLMWAGALLGNRVSGTVNATYSHNMRQPEFADLNFNPLDRFVLPDEGGRPVFVEPSSIVVGTGAVASWEGRLSPLHNRVTELRSGASSMSRQLSFQLAPLSLNSTFTWGLSYTLNSVRDRVSGFASTAGNPLEMTTGRSSSDWRHQIQLSIGQNLFDVVRISWYQRFMSGMPFTPVVAGDVNGDGYANDRAFVADAAVARSLDPALANAMSSLLAGSSDRVRGCLERQLGQIAARNSCEGPWTSQASMSVSFNPVKVRLPQRATLSFTVSNPLGAADLLLHGESHAHGWGQPGVPDPRLLVVRGFDQEVPRFRYEVNQRFGNTRQSVSAIRVPVTLTGVFRIDVGPTRERQGLTQTLDRGRTLAGTKMSEPMLKLVYGSAGITNPMAAILREAESLRLNAKQADSLAAMNRWYIIHLDSIWSPVAKYYASLPERYDDDAVYAQYRRAREASVDLLVRIVPGVRELLTGEQHRMLPPLVAAYLDLRYLSAIRSGTSGNPGGVFAPGAAGVPGGPGGGRSG